MKANELRIGSLVKIDGKETAVETITEDGINYLFAPEGLYVTKFDEIKPIPLTEEWLLRFGFKKHGILGSYIKSPGACVKGYGFRFHTQYPGSDDKFSFVTEVYFFDSVIHVKNGLKHVHRLQNLYFALTGEELIYKP